MKQALTLLLLASSLVASALNPDTLLMTIGSKEISVGEFEYLYKKNNQVVNEEESSIEDYVDLFVNFKLKVLEAEELGMDTISSFVKELGGYQDQLAAPYLKDQDLDEQLIKEAYERLKEEVSASHILVNIEGKDTLPAYTKIIEARNKIVNGEDFKTVAKQYSDDKSVVMNGGHLGFFTGFQMVLPFEEAAFNLDIDEVSMPIRTRFGYHIIQLHDRRPSSGEIKLSHILIQAHERMSEEDQTAKKELAFKVSQELKDGGDYDELAAKYSEDHNSARRGGSIGYIKRGQTIQPFEDVAFSMTEEGSISEPVQTRFGWHIIRYEGKKGLPSFEEKKSDIKRRLARDERGTKPEKVFIARLKNEYDYKVNQDKLEAIYNIVEKAVIDSTIEAQLMAMDDIILTLGDISKTQKDFAQDCLNKKIAGRDFEKQFAAFEKATILDYEKTQLARKYPDYKYLTNEYHDGLLLFEISNQKVWGKASQDTTGLAKFYKKNKKNYRFKKATYAGKIVYLKDSATLAQFQELNKTLSEGEARDSINNDSLMVRIEQGYYAFGNQISSNYFLLDEKHEGLKSEFPIALALGQRYETGAIKPLESTRGAVISDYQNKLEKQWIKALRKQYKVKVDKAVLNLLEQ